MKNKHCALKFHGALSALNTTSENIIIQRRINKINNNCRKKKKNEKRKKSETIVARNKMTLVSVSDKI